MTLKELAQALDLPFAGNPDLEINQLCGLQDLQPGGLVYIHNPQELANLPTPTGVFASQSKSTAPLEGFKGAVILPKDTKQPQGMNAIFASDPLAAHCQAASWLYPANKAEGEIHPTAWVDPTAKIGPGVRIDAQVAIYAGVEIGKGTLIRAGCVIMQDSQIGEDCLFYPNVSVREASIIQNRVILHAGAVIGSDGYGYFQRPGGKGYQNFKIPQVGRVVIESDVEIGSCACVDRARFHETRIGQGSKLDNLVHIAHNVVVGQDSLITAQSGIAGSTVTGANLMMGGQSGIRDNLRLGKGVKLLARTLVTANAKEGEELAGMPGRPLKEWRRTEALMQGLSGILKRLREMEQFLKGLGWKKKEDRPD